MAITLSLPSIDALKRAINLKQKIETLERTLQSIIGISPGTATTANGRGNGISAAGRARIAAAQRARWAKARGGRRTMSAAGRAKIAAAARRRWKAAKAAGKSRL